MATDPKFTIEFECPECSGFGEKGHMGCEGWSICTLCNGAGKIVNDIAGFTISFERGDQANPG